MLENGKVMPEIEKSLQLQANHFIDEIHKGNVENVSKELLKLSLLKLANICLYMGRHIGKTDYEFLLKHLNE